MATSGDPHLVGQFKESNIHLRPLPIAYAVSKYRYNPAKWSLYPLVR